jgi:hypothetical protein
VSDVYELIHPVTFKRRVAGAVEPVEELISSVEIRRVNGSDMRWLEDMQGRKGATLGLLGRLTGLTPTQVDLFDAEDIAGMAEVIEGFLPNSLGTGRTSSGT